MPICNKCDRQFPNSIIVEGKRKYLQHRKYCLDCSPWGEHNTKSLTVDRSTIEKDSKIFICKRCSKEYIYGRSSGNTLTYCASCMVNNGRTRQKQKAIDYKGGKCEICNYSKCNRALQFHHLDESKKEFTISSCHCRSWDSIQNELDKCILVCSNCHAEIHDKENKSLSNEIVPSPNG